jgi:hypothetical protein
MSYPGCEVCKNLLYEAGNAIAAHANAVSRLSEAVTSTAGANFKALEAEIRATSLAREACVEQYENHLAFHEMKTMTAGSGAVE